MACYQTPTKPASPGVWSLKQLLQQFAENGELPLSGVLSEALILELLAKHKIGLLQRICGIWSPTLVLWAFLTQVISPDKSCLAAVIRVAGLMVANGLPPCSDNTGAYCKARHKLPPGFVRDLMVHVALELENRAPRKWQWKGRRTFLVDGTTLTMPDTEANQQKYPQQRAQQPGLGFPILRLVVIFSLTTGAAIAIAWAPYRGKLTGESTLLRNLMGQFQPGDILIGDSIYGSYWMFVLARKRKLHLLFRQHHLRVTDFRSGKRFGKGDHLVEWTQTPRPEWMSKEEYKAMREELKTDPLLVRELSVAITTPGFRTKNLILATTLHDAAEFTKDDLALLYRQRWNVELDIRNLKTTMGMDHLRCKTPEMVEKEILAPFLAYNLIRKVMCQAAYETSSGPRGLSFNAARQGLVENRAFLAIFEGELYTRFCRLIVWISSRHKAGHRPDRVEPREKKRRPNLYDQLKKPRQEAQLELLSA